MPKHMQYAGGGEWPTTDLLSCSKPGVTFCEPRCLFRKTCTAYSLHVYVFAAALHEASSPCHQAPASPVGHSYKPW